MHGITRIAGKENAMNKLTKIVAPALAASLALGAAMPAAAAGWDRHGGGFGVKQQIQQLDRKIEQAERRHLISRDEANRLDRNLNKVERLHSTYLRGGLNRAELRTLDNRIDAVERQLSREIADRNGRSGRYRG